jgi:electron transfer flavoprotein alpha subunit
MMAKDVLVLAEIHRDALAGVTLESLAAARGLASATGGAVLVLVLGPHGAAHEQALGVADRIIVVDDPRLSDYSPGPYLAALQEIVTAEQPRAVLLGATSIGWDLAPLLSARIDAPLVTGCKEIQVDGDELRVTASFCGGKMTAESRVERTPAILLMLPGSFRPTNEPGQANVEPRKLSSPLDAGAVQFDGWVLPEAGDVDITQQDILVSVGRGIQQKDNVELAENLAQALGGAVCASRPVIDQGWLPATRQVGKSGMTVKPKLYLALGISGAPEHQEGMKGAELIIAVNTDSKAPIFDIAHYGAEMDVLDLLPALTEAVEAKKG